MSNLEDTNVTVLINDVDDGQFLHFDHLRYVDNHIAEQLRFLATEHYSKEWFLEAWNKYRDYIMDAVNEGLRRVKYPGFIFNPYLQNEFETNRKPLKEDEFDFVEK